MKRKDYNNYRKHILEQYQKAMTEATRQRDEALKGLESLWRAYHPNTGDSPVLDKTVLGTSQPSSTEPGRYGSLSKAILAALGKVPPVFTCKDVVGAMEIIAPEILLATKRSSISGCLNRLRGEKTIEEVEHGSGSSPSKYRLAPQDSGVNVPPKPPAG